MGYGIMWRRCYQQSVGFSLVELMAVLAVVGTLVALALPRYRLYVARGRQAEAIHNLGHIHTLQKSYNLKMQGLGLGDDLYFVGSLGGNGSQWDRCRTIDIENKLGFRVPDCNALRYTYFAYSTTFWQASNGGTGDHRIYPGCDERDGWHMCPIASQWCVDGGGVQVVGQPVNMTVVVKECTN